MAIAALLASITAATAAVQGGGRGRAGAAHTQRRPQPRFRRVGEEEPERNASTCVHRLHRCCRRRPPQRIGKRGKVGGERGGHRSSGAR